jgi:hypothetical protein
MDVKTASAESHTIAFGPFAWGKVHDVEELVERFKLFGRSTGRRAEVWFGSLTPPLRHVSRDATVTCTRSELHVSRSMPSKHMAAIC